jgi:hypothetical protein
VFEEGRVLDYHRTLQPRSSAPLPGEFESSYILLFMFTDVARR